MKKLYKIFAFLLVFAMLLGGCTPKATVEEPVVEEPTVEEPAEEKPVEEEPATEEPVVEPKEPQVLRVAGTTDVTTFDATETIGSYDTVPMLWVYETLVEVDPNSEIQPLLATSWEKIDDLSWTFKLRDDVYFIDGTQMNAEAVKFCLERASQSTRQQSYSGFIDHVDVVDEFTVTVFTKFAVGHILYVLGDPRNSIYSPTAFEKNGGAEGIVNNPVGSGPWKLEELVLGDHSYYVRNENYWGEKPAIDRIEWTIIPEEGTRLIALKNGEVDLIYNPAANEIENIKADDSLTMIISPRARTVFLGLNAESEQLADPNLRYAIQLAINTDEINDTILEGTQRYINLNGLFPPEVMTVTKPTLEAFNPEKAKEVLATTSYNGEPITFYAPKERYMRDSQVAEVIQAQLAAVGINVDLQILEFTSLTSTLANGDNVIALYGWGNAFLDPYVACDQLLNSTSVLNYYGFRDTEADEMMKTGAGVSDRAERLAIFQEVQRRAIEDSHSLLPLYYMNNMWASTAKLKGIWIKPSELVNIDLAYFED
jgi:peptide/nickel transport system substrate-binding protein